MTSNPYDQACRYLLRLWGAPLLAWLLGLDPAHLDFVGWLDARQVVWPGQPDRTCDTVAHLRDPMHHELPWAAVVEFQIAPDELMFGRGLGYLGDLWLAVKPTEHKGDRFCVGLVVVNLRGRGSTSRRMRLSGTRLGASLTVEERNLSRLSASRVLKQVEAGAAPRDLLAWIPLFKGGGQRGIIPGWLRLAEQEADVERRRSLALAAVFADAAGSGPLWREAMKGWEDVESQTVIEWTAKARQQGKVEGKADALLQVLEERFGVPPQELIAAIQGCTDLDTHRQWMHQALKVKTLAAFRKATGL